MDSRYISFELLRKVPTTAVFGQVGNDSKRRLYFQPRFNYYARDDHHTFIIPMDGRRLYAWVPLKGEIPGGYKP